MIKNFFQLFFLSLWFALPFAIFAQIKVPFNTEKWQIKAQNVKLEKLQGFDSIYAEGGQALLKDVDFLDGTIEFDILMQNKFSFPGLTFRMQDDFNYEEFYLRPFESGKEDANQYSPVFNGVSGWQFYLGEGFNKAYEYPLNQWMHVKLVISGNYGEVYFGNDKTPALIISELKREPKAGKIALTLDQAHFANFSYTPGSPELTRKTLVISKAQIAGNVVDSWMISDVFKENLLERKYRLDDGFISKFNWSKMSAETNNGLINIARLRKKEKDSNTVFAKLVINSDQDRIKHFSVGFSDRVKIYFNNQLIYSGNDGFRTRDFRFLGSIGYFDDLYLPLKKGENILLLAVSENFGGWGLQGKFEETDGLTLISQQQMENDIKYKYAKRRSLSPK
jgi:hypothetical protein